MKNILIQMFNGWIIHEASWNGEKHTRDPIDCMIEACNGDKVQGYIIHLFDYWSNDIQSMSPHYGIELLRDNTRKLVIGEVPPAPSPNHWWNEGKWVEPTDETFDKEVVQP